MNNAELTPIWEYEQSEDTDFILEKILEFLFEDVKETLDDGKNNNHRAYIPASKNQ